MPEKKVICPKCNMRMERGFIPDYSRGTVLVGCWLKGVPQKTSWLLGSTQASSGEYFPVGAFRCPKCGFVELYADASFEAE